MQIREEVAAREGEAGFSTAEEPMGEEEFEKVRAYVDGQWRGGSAGIGMFAVGLVWYVMVGVRFSPNPILSICLLNRNFSTRVTWVS